MISPYWMTILPISYIFVQNIGQTIEKNASLKMNLVHINMLYNQHLECLKQKGYSYNDKIDENNLHNENNYKVIIQNKNMKELEICKNTYLNFILAYRKYKKDIF